MTVRNVSDEEKIALARDMERAWELQDDEDLRRVMGTPGGRRFVWRILEQCGVNHPNPTDQDTLRRLGRRDVGLVIQEWLFTFDSKMYTLMLNEAQAREQLKKERLDA